MDSLPSIKFWDLDKCIVLEFKDYQLEIPDNCLQCGIPSYCTIEVVFDKLLSLIDYCYYTYY